MIRANSAMVAGSDESTMGRQKDLIGVIQSLRRTDNVTNWFYIVRTYLYLGAIIASTIAWHYTVEARGWSTAWSLPVIAVAVVLVGAGQHQLTALAHEAAHHILFRHRLLNDFASDWLLMFPMFSCTHHYRLQHMAHHQFVNDPDRDPDVSQLQTSGHWLRFPMPPREFVRTIARQLWLPRLIKYIRVRAQYNSMGTEKNPYLKKGWKPSKLAVLVGLGYMALLVGSLTALVRLGDAGMLLALAGSLWLGAMAFYALLPARFYHQSRFEPVISMRAMSLMRISFITILFTGLAWVTLATGKWAAAWFLLLWMLPMVSSFSFFMILRQLVQHGNGGRGWLTNTRIFLVSPAIRFAVFPLGQDYHLPHHMYASVPHYRLPALHQALLSDPDYAAQAVVVEGYFFSKTDPPTHPTVLDVLARNRDDGTAKVYLDHSVLDADTIEDKEAIIREGETAIGAAPFYPNVAS